jgi:glycosyltransferase involved in cell wall biosynthesis
MTLLVKDEIDIVESVIRYHRSVGVDFVVVTDNTSTDGTLEVLLRLKEEGLVDVLIEEPSDDYSQAKWVDRMIRVCADSGCDWVMNCDADEFWYPKSGSIKTELENTRATVLLCPIYNVLPEVEPFYKNTRRIERSIDVKKYGIGTYSLFGTSIPKVIHRVDGYTMIHMGNHMVDSEKLSVIESSSISIFHYSIRGSEHFVRKMVAGGAAYERNTKLGKNVGAHWRHYYNGMKDGSLDLQEEYKHFIRADLWDGLEKKGVIVRNTAISDYFSRNNVIGSDATKEYRNTASIKD